MAHEHHHHDHTVTSLNKAFILGIALNVAFVVVEFAVGLYYGSMGLLSDAGHNLSDVASLLLAMLAFRLAQAHATPRPWGGKRDQREQVQSGVARCEYNCQMVAGCYSGNQRSGCQAVGAQSVTE